MQNSKTLLGKPTANRLLQVAKRNLAKDGHLEFVLFVRFGDRQEFEVIGLRDVMRAESSEQKAFIMALLGQRLCRRFGPISEALIVVESWYVSGQEAGAFSVRPSRHPKRQEAIFLIGRNAANSRHSFVVQPFGRDADQKPVWEQMPIAIYNQPRTKACYAIGLLDCLFTDEPETSN